MEEEEEDLDMDKEEEDLDMDEEEEEEDLDMEEEETEMEEEEEDLDMEEEEEDLDLDMEEEEEDLDMEEDLTINESENMAGTVFEDVPVKEEPVREQESEQVEIPSSRSADKNDEEGKKISPIVEDEDTNESGLSKQVTTGLYIGAGLVATLVLTIAWRFKSIRRKYGDVSTNENINDENV